MNDPDLERAKEPLKRFILRNRNLTGDEKVEAYGMLLDCIIDVVKASNKKTLDQVRKEVFSK